MARRFVDDGGNNSDGLSWANAYTSINALISAEASFLTTGGNEVVFGADMQCQATNTATLTITGPANGPPIRFISSTVGSGTTVSYSKGTGNQIDTSENSAYALILDGAIACFGMKLKAGSYIRLGGDNTERAYNYDCDFLPGNGSYVQGSPTYGNLCVLDKCRIDLTQDSGSSSEYAYRSTGGIGYSGRNQITELSLLNASNRTAELLFLGGFSEISACDFSGLSASQVLAEQAGEAYITNCKMNWATPPTEAAAGNPQSDGRIVMTNCGNSDRPWWIYTIQVGGSTTGSSFTRFLATDSAYRDGGAVYDGKPVSWYCTPNATWDTPRYSPWMYGSFSSTGSKNVAVYIAQDSGSTNLQDDEVWLEVEYPGTSGQGLWAIARDRFTIPFGTPADQTTDSSTWTGISETNMQELSVDVTVGQAGPFRCRVVVGDGTTAFYIDPKPVVS